MTSLDSYGRIDRPRHRFGRTGERDDVDDDLDELTVRRLARRAPKTPPPAEAEPAPDATEPPHDPEPAGDLASASVGTGQTVDTHHHSEDPDATDAAPGTPPPQPSPVAGPEAAELAGPTTAVRALVAPAARWGGMTAADAVRVIGLELNELRALAADQRAEQARLAQSIDATHARCVELIDALGTPAKRRCAVTLIASAYEDADPATGRFPHPDRPDGGPTWP